MQNALKTTFVCLLFVFVSPLFAYLDPGSGSLLLSSIVAIFASFVYFFKNLFYRAISLSPSSLKMLASKNALASWRPKTKPLVGGNAQDNVDSNAKKAQDSALSSIVFYCEGRQYYLTFKPILDALDALAHPYTYLAGDENDPALKRNNPQGNVLEFIGCGNAAYARLNFLKADICVLTASGLGVLQLKRSRAVQHYCHIVHSLTPMTYRTFGTDYFDSVLVANEIQERFVREVEAAHKVAPKHIAIVGLTYMDELSMLYEVARKAPKNLPSDTPTILVSPSWGRESLLSKYGLRILEPLVETNYHIIIRPHPQSMVGKAEAAHIASLQSALAPHKNVEWDIGTPNVYAFSRASIMVSDFSSVIFDFACLTKKPILTVDFTFDPAGYDVGDIYNEENIGEFYTFKTLEKIGGRIKERDFACLKSIIDAALDSQTNAESLKAVKNELWHHPMESGERAALELIKIEQEILESHLASNELNRLRSLDAMLNKRTANAS